MVKSILFLLLNLIAFNLEANCHYKEYLIFQKDTLLVNYIRLPDSLTNLLHLKAINKNDCISLNCLDGEGRKVWEIRNDSLFLKEMLNCCGNRLLDKDSVNLLRQKDGKEELFCGWLTQKIYHQFGNKIKAFSDECYFEFDRDFHIENGHLVGIENYDNRKSKESIYRKEGHKLLKFWYEKINWNLIEDSNLDKKKTVVLRFVVNEKGNPTNIEVFRSKDEIVNTELIRVLEQLPDWDRYYKRGVLQIIKWNLPVKLNKEWYESRIKNREHNSIKE